MRLYSSTFFLDDTTVLALLIAVHILIGLAGISCNALVWSFYRRKQENVAHFLYFILTSVDMVSGVVPLLHALLLILILQKSESSGGLKVLLPVVYFFTSVMSRVSVFLCTIVAVVRTLNIALPGYVIKKNVVVASLLACVLLWAVLLSGDMVVYKENVEGYPRTFPLMLPYYLTFPVPGHYFCEKILVGLGIELDKQHQSYEFFLYIGIPFVLPTFVCLFCMSVQIWHLTAKGIRSSNRQNIKKHITITILLLTSVFAFCNITYVAVLYGKYWLDADFSSLLFYIMINMLPYFNSLLNPIILMVRGKSLNRFARDTIRGMVPCCSRNTRINLQPTEELETRHPSCCKTATRL